MKAFGFIFTNCHDKYAKSTTFIDESYHLFPFFANTKHLYKPMGHVLFKNVKTRCRNPYNTCRFMKTFGTVFGNGPRKEPERIQWPQGTMSKERWEGDSPEHAEARMPGRNSHNKREPISPSRRWGRPGICSASGTKEMISNLCMKDWEFWFVRPAKW